MQENKQEKSAIKQNILLYLSNKGVTSYEFYKISGVTRGILQQGNGISEDNIAKFLAYAPDVNIEWLLTGKGDMLKHASTNVDSTIVTPLDNTDQPKAMPLANVLGNIKVKPIPLVTETAAAGFGNGLLSIEEKDVKEYYVIPKFRYCNVDFMIEVSGLSMYPHFNPGDVIACTILKDRKFLQWNKCHVIATREQGILVKRLMPSTKDGYITVVSDNKEYPAFDVPFDEITGLALVVGFVGLE